jgi:hypothetical protein
MRDDMPYNESHRTPWAEMVQVIRVKFLRGAGTEADPVREVRAYYSEDGAYLCDDDTYPHEPPPKGTP